MSWQDALNAQVRNGRNACRALARAGTEQKNCFLSALGERLRQMTPDILKANAADVAAARRRNISPALIDRLILSAPRIEAMVRAVSEIRVLEDPVGRVLWETVRPNGLRIRKVSVPIGLIAIIYESRPDVTVEAASLCLKAGNAVLLRGGKEASRTNRILAEALKRSLEDASLPADGASLVLAGGRRAVRHLLTREGEIDLVIPRGGESLISTVTRLSRIPVIKHYKGVCHTYVDRAADIGMALAVSFNAKVQRPATCNATETLLVHQEIAGAFLPRMAEKFREAGVRMKGCPAARRLIPEAEEATEADWSTEYLDLVINIRVVPDIDAAIDHITRYGTRHSEAIISQDKNAAAQFLRDVDAACVFHNASTRFTDGGQFGLGAEIGISTDKIHARGPMGLNELTIYKYVAYGNGQVRS